MMKSHQIFRLGPFSLAPSPYYSLLTFYFLLTQDSVP